MDKTLSLFGDDVAPLRPAPDAHALGQYPTPVWLTEAVIEQYFPALDRDDLVIEPTCGPGHFLQAIPAHVPAIGVELDPALAALARERTGREVTCGDFRSVTLRLERPPTLILGNPPFRGALITEILERCHDLLPEHGRVGFILPAFYFQAAQSILSLSKRWSIRQDIIPRNIYPRLRYPLVFALLSKDQKRTLVGFAFYQETAAALATHARYRDILTRGQGNVWRKAVETALFHLGGEASLAEIYETMRGRQPTANPHWKEKIRQILQLHCERVAPARYRLIARPN